LQNNKHIRSMEWRGICCFIDENESYVTWFYVSACIRCSFDLSWRLPLTWYIYRL